MPREFTADELTQMVIELQMGEPPTITGPDADAQRARLTTQIAEITARGGMVDVPFELPAIHKD